MLTLKFQSLLLSGESKRLPPLSPKERSLDCKQEVKFILQLCQSALYRTVQKQYRIGLLITHKKGDIKRVISERFLGRSEAARHCVDIESGSSHIG